jgi:hypothetical protein
MLHWCMVKQFSCICSSSYLMRPAGPDCQASVLHQWQASTATIIWGRRENLLPGAFRPYRFNSNPEYSGRGRGKLTNVGDCPNMSVYSGTLL